MHMATRWIGSVYVLMCGTLGLIINACCLQMVPDMDPQTAATTLAPSMSVARLRSACEVCGIPNRGEHKVKALKVFQHELTTLNADI